MKRIFCLLLAACMMLSLCACGKGREKDAGNDTLSSNEEASASAESIPTPKEQETPGESEPSQPYAGKVDVDLTVLSSTMATPRSTICSTMTRRITSARPSRREGNFPSISS